MYAGINDAIFERDEVEATHNMEKEEIDAWISGSTAVKESTEARSGSDEGIFVMTFYLTLRFLVLLIE